MRIDLSGKSAFVSGSTQGIGADVATAEGAAELFSALPEGRHPGQQPRDLRAGAAFGGR
jgi:hypothetical protein